MICTLSANENTLKYSKELEMDLPSNFDKYNGFIFDLDGTLIDSMPFHVKAWQQVCQEHGFSIEESFIYDRGGKSSLNIVRELQALGFGTQDEQEFVKRKVELYREKINEVPLFDEIAKILKQAKERGAKITIGTGTQRINALDILNIRNLEQYVDFIVSADDVTNHKPHPETYLVASKLMSLPAEQCVVFEDGKPGFAAAKAAHMDCVVVDRGQIIDFIAG